MNSNSKKIIPLAKIGRTRGLKGQVRVDIYNPESKLFSPGQFFRISETTGFEKLTIVESSGEWFVFKEIQSPEDAKKIVNQELYLFRDEMPALKKGSHYHVDLFGCMVIDQRTNQKVGILKDILYTASNDVWVIEQDNKEEILIPMLEGVLGKVDLDAKTILVHIPETV